MTTVPQLAQTLQTVFTTTADAAARATGFVQRRSKLTGAAFVQALVFGWLANPHASSDPVVTTTAHTFKQSTAALPTYSLTVFDTTQTLSCSWCRLSDLGSHNGTYVKDERVNDALLRDGDSIRFGDARFTFRR